MKKMKKLLPIAKKWTNAALSFLCAAAYGAVGVKWTIDAMSAGALDGFHLFLSLGWVAAAVIWLIRGAGEIRKKPESTSEQESIISNINGGNDHE